jgi:hypothetical protein
LGRTATAKLTSEERCRKAFETETGYVPPVPIHKEGEFVAGVWYDWFLAWRYLESRVTEFIQE